uniref:hypothetical protein n=1 Tax=Alloprevotella sp. TaxID=1872471 RepID=UPI0040265293
ALTGRRGLYTDTQGVALGSELTALSGRSFSRFVRLSCAHASPLAIWLKTAQIFFWILNTLRKYTAFITKRTLMIGKQHWDSINPL